MQLSRGPPVVRPGPGPSSQSWSRKVAPDLSLPTHSCRTTFDRQETENMSSTTTREYDKVTAVRLNQQDYSKLVRIADSLGITRSDVIRILLREYERIELVVAKV